MLKKGLVTRKTSQAENGAQTQHRCASASATFGGGTRFPRRDTETRSKNKGSSFSLPCSLLFVLCSLFFACSMSLPENNEHHPSPGMGSVQINFNNEMGRAILPNDPGLSSFLGGFDLVFTPVAPTTGLPLTRHIDAADPSDSVNVPVGTYTVDAIAYVGPAASIGAAAAASSTGDSPGITAGPGATITAGVLTVSEDGSHSLIVDLRPIADGSTTAGELGTFEWTITSDISDTDYTSATMKITPVGSIGDASISDIDLLGSGWNSSIDIAYGYYYVDIVLEVGGLTRTFRHILHVYQNMTSSFTYHITNDHMGM